MKLLIHFMLAAATFNGALLGSNLCKL